MSGPSRRELLKAVYKLDLYSFLQRSFGVLEPGNRFMPAAYLELLCAALMQVDARAVKRLIINTPPRHLKSFVTSVVFPAWLLMRDPKTKIAVICHSDMLANDLASKCKRLIESDDYRQIAPQVQIRQDRDRRMDFETTRGGGVYFASIASGITGRGFDHIILDDPIAANDAQSAAERDRVQQAFDDMISSRLHEPARGTITVVQQRLHEADLSGYFLSKGGWDILCLPLVAEEEETYKFGNYEWRRPAGDVLLPERFPEAEIQKIRANNGETIFATQYQQHPTSTRGELIKPEYLIPLDACPPGATRIFIAVDTAVKQTAASAYTVFLVIATDGPRHYVVDVLRGATHSYERIREQARLQMEGRAAGHTIYEVLPVVQGFGLSCLPPPSPGDIFLDLEGDPFVGEGDLEYLFGYTFGINFVLSNCTWEDGEVVATFRQPFDLLAETTAIAARHAAGNTANSAKGEIWLPFLDTYRTMCLAPQPHFRRVLENVWVMQLAA